MGSTATADEKPAQAQGDPVAEHPDLVKAKLELELAKVALEKQRLALSDQSERAKLVQGMVPDLGTAVVEKDTTTASDKPPALAESLVQRAVQPLADDLADQVVVALKRTTHPVPTDHRTLFVTSDTTYLSDLAAHRDVTARLGRLTDAIEARCPTPTTHGHSERQDGQPGTRNRTIAPGIVLGALNALPGAISLATRLLAHQYTTSSYNSSTGGALDVHVAGALMSRIQQDDKARVFISRLQPATDSVLEEEIHSLATVMDTRLARARTDARVTAEHAGQDLGRLTARVAQLIKRADDIFAGWKDKVGKAVGAAGLTEDLALAASLEKAIAHGDPDSDSTKSQVKALEAVKKRIEAVLTAVSSGSGEVGTADLLLMLRDIEAETEDVIRQQSAAQDAKTEADQRVADLDAVNTACTDLLEALDAADGQGVRLIDRAMRGALLAAPDTLVVFARIHHSGADDVLETKPGADHRTSLYGATAEWALLTGDGLVVDAGVRTGLGYFRYAIGDPRRTESGLVDYLSVSRETLGARATGSAARS